MLAFHGRMQLKEAETENLSASRQQNQAIFVGTGKNGRVALRTAERVSNPVFAQRAR